MGRVPVSPVALRSADLRKEIMVREKAKLLVLNEAVGCEPIQPSSGKKRQYAVHIEAVRTDPEDQTLRTRDHEASMLEVVRLRSVKQKGLGRQGYLLFAAQLHSLAKFPHGAMRPAHSKNDAEVLLLVEVSKMTRIIDLILGRVG